MWETVSTFLSNFWSDLSIVTIIPEYEGGVHLRKGKYLRTLPPGGMYFKLPFIDEFVTTQIVTTTLDLRYQTLTTKDNKSIVVSATVKYHISEPKKYLLYVTDRKSVLDDVVRGIICNTIRTFNFADLNIDLALDKITKAARKEVNKYGFKIECVTFTDVGSIKSLRVLWDTNPEHDV